MQATLRGRTHNVGRETTSAAFFFLFGQSGYFLGPVVAGPLLDRFGLSGLLWLAGFVGLIGLNAARQLGPTAEFKPLIYTPKETVADRNQDKGWRKRALPLIAFALVAAFQAWSQQNITTFMPKYLSDQGLSASVYGLVVAIFAGGSAIGGTIGGSLADRFGKRRVAASSLALASIPLFLVSQLGWSPWYYLLIPLAGGLTGAVHSILVVLAQRAIPGGMALASGLILGYMFTSGALGTLLCGYLADQWGFPPVFLLTAGIALTASMLALTLRKN
jgi:FSR family fosmidomycin resistance protein-like MFS transporter